MIWRDLILNKKVGDPCLVSTLSEVFKLQENKVRIVDSLEKSDKESSVTCVVSRLLGDYPLFCTLYVSFEIENEMNILGNISEKLDSDILVSDDDSINPYAMLLISKKGVPKKIRIDSDLLDNNNEYKVLED